MSERKLEFLSFQ